MTQERLALVVKQATEIALGEEGAADRRSEITVIRTGVWFTVGEAKAQVIVGRSGAGYHLGLCAHEPPAREALVWGPALPSQSHVQAAAEDALDKWLEIMSTEQ